MNAVKIQLCAFMLLVSANLAQAEEGKLGITLDTTYVSKYIWHGFDFYADDHSATQPSVDVDLWGTGFGVTLWHSRANGSGFRDFEEFDYIVYYGNTAFADTPYAMDYTFSWLYYDYFDAPSRHSDLQEFIQSFSWPNLLPGGVVPSYSVGKLWPARSSSPVLKGIGGWVHVFGLGYDLTVPGILSNNPEQVVSLMADLTYNDGYNGATVDHDWSHATLGVSTGIQIAKNLTFTPGLYYQISMDDSVNREDEFWTSLSLTYKF